MSGLLIKDLLILKSGWKAYGFLAVIFAAVSFMGNVTYFSSMMVMFCLMLPLSSFTADEMARWDRFAATLPRGKKAMVRSKYQYLFVVVGGAGVLSVLVNLLLYAAGKHDGNPLPVLLVNALTSVLAGLLINCVMYPLMFKYGSQKGRVVLVIVVAVLAAAVVMGMTLLNLGNTSLVVMAGGLIPRLSPAWVFLLLAVVLIIALIISYRVSQRIYAKKEF